MKNALLFSLILCAGFFVSCDNAGKDPIEGDTKSEQVKKGDNPMVLISTNQGDVKLELDNENAPITVENFLSYVNDGYYNETIFHRVIPGFMVQGGGFTEDMNQKTTRDPIKNEADNGLQNNRGTVAMARTQVVDSATSQFFINLKDNDFLNNGSRDFGYAVFGKVVEGMDVVDKIASVDTGTVEQLRDVPEETVIINSIQVVK